MAHPLPPGLTPSEVAFVCEMEMVTIVPRQRLERIELLSGPTQPLRPPHRAQLPLWLALLLKKQRRANIVPPPWLHPASLSEIIRRETIHDPISFSAPPPTPARGDSRGFAHHVNTASTDDGSEVVLSPPFLPSCTAEAPAGYLPYHWLEMAETLLAHAGDDMPATVAEVRGLMRDLIEVRSAKMRGSTTQLDTFGGGVMNLRGVGAMELAENRGFMLGVVDGVRKLGASAETTRREEEEEGGSRGGGVSDDDDDEDMGI